MESLVEYLFNVCTCDIWNFGANILSGGVQVQHIIL